LREAPNLLGFSSLRGAFMEIAIAVVGVVLGVIGIIIQTS